MVASCRLLVVMACAALVGNRVAVCQQVPPASGAPVQMLGGPIAPGVFVSAQRMSEGGSTLRIREGEQDSSVTLPYQTITAATKMTGGLIVAGVLPDQGVDYRLLTFVGGQWVPSVSGMPYHGSYVAKMSWRDGLLAMMLADGSVVSAPFLVAEDMPTGDDFELVGSAPAGVSRSIPVAFLDVVNEDRIEVYLHPSNRHAFVRQPLGGWIPMRADRARSPVLMVETLARVGDDVRFVATTTGPVILEEEGSSSWWPVADEVPESGRGVLPSQLSSVLHADRRYRLKTHEVAGSWFYPAAIAGVAWAANGIELQECRVYESGVRMERGSMIARTTLHLAREHEVERVAKVAFVATTAAPTPPTSIRGGHAWLVPDQALMAEKPLSLNRRSYALAVAVPIPTDSACVGRWIHIQLVVLDAYGAVLGATGVRSVRILPNRGMQTSAQEQSGRSSAVSYWAAHGVESPQEFWESIVGQ